LNDNSLVDSGRYALNGAVRFSSTLLQPESPQSMNRDAPHRCDVQLFMLWKEAIQVIQQQPK
jgi:hypothetical protein